MITSSSLTAMEPSPAPSCLAELVAQELFSHINSDITSEEILKEEVINEGTVLPSLLNIKQDSGITPDKIYDCPSPSCNTRHQSHSEFLNHWALAQAAYSFTQETRKQPKIIDTYAALQSLEEKAAPTYRKTLKFICSGCKKEFITSKELTQHFARRHTTETPYACTQCSNKYSTKSSLDLHLIRIHGPKKCICSVNNCKAQYGVRGDLNQHIKRKHKDLLDKTQK